MFGYAWVARASVHSRSKAARVSMLFAPFDNTFLPQFVYAPGHKTSFSVK